MNPNILLFIQACKSKFFCCPAKNKWQISMNVQNFKFKMHHSSFVNQVTRNKVHLKCSLFLEAASKAVIANREERSGKQSQKD